MTTKDEALRLALEALEKCKTALAEELSAWDIDPPLHHVQESHDLCAPAITAIKEALAAPEQEPVAWMHVMDNTEGIKANGKGFVSITQKRKHPFGKPGVDFSKSYPVTSTPLYTTPPAAQRQWIGLTHEDIRHLCGQTWVVDTVKKWVEIIEAKLMEKNT